MSERLTKVEQIEKILRRRIMHGDYSIDGLPSERELCEELNVSRMTARKALERLIQAEYVERQKNGRLIIRRNLDQQMSVGFLAPSLSSASVEKWRLALETVASSMQLKVITMMYVHWDAPIIMEALENLDVIFLNMSAEKVPPRILKEFQKHSDSLVILDHDMTMYGLKSICPFPPHFVQRLLDVLGEQGHRSVDCFNIQTIDNVISGRIEQWNLWRATHNIDGRLLGQELSPYSYPETPLSGAYRQMLSILDNHQLKSSALFCTTAPAALGAIRAMLDRGIQVGKDVSVCVINDEGFAQYVNPTITSVMMIDPVPYLKICLERIKSHRSVWQGSILFQPSEPKIFIGQSTGPAPLASEPLVACKAD